jgi:hypothetical protein
MGLGGAIWGRLIDGGRQHLVAAGVPRARESDGVLVDSPREHAWREALSGFAEPTGFTTLFYQAHVAGKPRPEEPRAAGPAL